jgi:hypothetical protein
VQKPSSLEGWPSERISERVQLLRDIGKGLQADGVIPVDTVVFREARLLPMVRGYFLLNEAYKGWRIENGHNTEKPKIAALQAVVIARFQPFLPINPSDARTTSEARCNEIFALAYAGAILERPFVPNSPEKLDFWMRLLEIISGSSAETLEPFYHDVAMQIDRPLNSYTIAILKKDKLAINSLISIFELISAKGIELLR